MRDLQKDLLVVARDTEALLRATAEVTGERVQEARSRAEKSLQSVLEHVSDRRLRRQVRRIARNTDSYVRDHSWSVIGAIAGVALIVGLLSRRE
ncbi:MAG: YqjD family protein [Povalibacter sp.]